MRWGLLVALCGCNPLFGISETALWDAAPDSPDIDAPPPPACPDIGKTPTFGTELDQVIARNVRSFTIDAKGTLAAGVFYNSTAYADMPGLAEPGVAFEAPVLKPEAKWPQSVRLAPEGDMMFVTLWITDSYTTVPYTRGADGTWTAGTAFKPQKMSTYYYGSMYAFSAPTRGPMRRFVTSVYDGTTGYMNLVEIEHDGTAATEKWRTPVSEYGVYTMAEPNLSPDGLRLVFVADQGGVVNMGGGGYGSGSDYDGGSGSGSSSRNSPLMYLDRASRDVPFSGTAAVIDAVPDYVHWPQMTEDCGRIYFYALDTTWYLKQ